MIGMTRRARVAAALRTVESALLGDTALRNAAAAVERDRARARARAAAALAFDAVHAERTSAALPAQRVSAGAEASGGEPVAMADAGGTRER